MPCERSAIAVGGVAEITRGSFASVLGAPVSAGASLVAGAALATGFVAQIALGVVSAGVSSAECLG